MWPFILENHHRAVQISLFLLQFNYFFLMFHMLRHILQQGYYIRHIDLLDLFHLLLWIELTMIKLKSFQSWYVIEIALNISASI